MLLFFVFSNIVLYLGGK